MSATKTGVVKFFNADKGFGFITPDGASEDIFVHVTALKNADQLSENQKVSFDTEPSERKPGKFCAVNVMVLA